MEITELLRELSEQEGTRIKSQLANELEQVLLEEAIRCYPSLKDTTTGDTVRLFHAGTVFSNLINLLIYPSREDDKDLGDMLAKIKGKWKWSEAPVQPADPEGAAR